MTFLFKIWSNYDGFTPSEIPDRQLANGQIELHWSRYVESVERNSEIWVYFFGRHRFENGVYVKGTAYKVNIANHKVYLRVREFSTTHPLTDSSTGARIADVVAPRNRQVFLLPEELDYAPACTVNTTADSCAARHCASCVTWNRLPRVRKYNLQWPEHLADLFDDYVPGYWVIPPRNFVHHHGHRFKSAVKQTSELFYRFKVGEESLAYLLALRISDNLAQRGLEGFDCIVPVPLSPDKAQRGEIHRTRLLATELSRLLGSPRRELLRLTKAVSKKQLRRGKGYGAARFETAYLNHLAGSQSTRQYKRILLVDDVCTEGNTLSACGRKLVELSPTCEIVAATAGQMTVRAAVRNESSLIE